MNPAAALPAISEETLVDQYLAQLAQLSTNARLELIARLSQTLKSAEARSQPDAGGITLPAFVGAWANDPEAEAMEATIQNSRHFVVKSELEQWP